MVTRETMICIEFLGQGSSIDNTPTQGQPEKFVAAKYSTGKVNLNCFFTFPSVN